MPPIIIVINSDSVILLMYGRTVSGASVWPMNTLAQTLVVSAPDTRITLVIAHAIARTITCITPRWYSTLISAAKKMIVGNTWKAKMKPYFGMLIRSPKMKFDPALTKLSTLTKPLPRALNTSLPPGTSSTSAAKAICSVTPVTTSFQSTDFLLLENDHAMPISITRPNRPKATRAIASTQFSPAPCTGCIAVRAA